MDDVLKDWRKLSLTSKEGEKVELKNFHFLEKNEHVLAARFMTRRALNVEAVGRTFKPLWRARKDFEIREAGDQVLFIFELETDAERVLAMEPWSFDKHVVLFQRYDFSVPTKNRRFTTMKFWVQMHGLPKSMLKPEVAMELGEKLGVVRSANHTNEMIGGNFIRVRVEIDVSEPLCRGRRVVLNDKDEVWVSLKYEKLSNFCYWCGKVSHTEKECDKWLASKGTLSVEQQEYGAWLRALPHNPGKAVSTKVSGMGDGYGRTQSMKTMREEGQMQVIQRNQSNREADKDATSNQQGLSSVNKHSQEGGANGEVSMVQTAANPDSMETFPRNTQVEEVSNFERPGTNPILSTTPDQDVNFESQLHEIDSAIHESDSKSILSNVPVIPSGTSFVGDHVGEDKGVVVDPSLESSRPLGTLTREEHPSDIPTLRTWKKLARDFTSVDSPMQQTVLTKRSRNQKDSGYMYLMYQESDNSIRERPSDGRKIWKLIWSLSVAKKVKKFLWRSCKEALPVKHNLMKRKVLQADRCDHCNEESESVIHALWKCLALSPVWSSIPDICPSSTRNLSSVSDLVLQAQK
ncbi:hypothetical protein CMV_011216 [Castanea mollissima]|uniref:CCHC-type domain-containing protein n=1 Tax=Castanea mollissima TaxID=60419 RepID=A0A8J4RDG7_9ROSI|nr:hypothetical protein CMV_011216 [Castanea mollissima]